MSDCFRLFKNLLFLANERHSEGIAQSYNEEAVKEADEMAPNFLFSPTDINVSYTKPLEGLHGLGYRGVKTSTVLSESYGTVEAALKINKNSKGVSGQVIIMPLVLL